QKKDFERRILLGGEDTLQESNLAGCVARVSFLGTRNCRGSRARQNGLLFSLQRKVNHCEIESCWLWNMMLPCDAKNCASWKSEILIQASVSSVFALRRRKDAGSG